MFLKDFNGLPLWQFKNISSCPDVGHFVSGRKGGVSTGEKESLNLSFTVGDDEENVIANREKIANSLGITPGRLIFPVQTHKVNVGVVEKADDIFEDTDALISNVPGLCIGVMSADCVPLLFFDPVKRVIGAAHAGWKGTVGKIAAFTVRAMTERFGSRPPDLIVGIGPSISPEIYEVSSDVIKAVTEAFGTKQNLIERENAEGKGFFNLWEANKVQLLEVGVKEENIEVASICTYKNSDAFFSARKSNYKAGRFAAGIILT